VPNSQPGNSGESFVAAEKKLNYSPTRLMEDGKVINGYSLQGDGIRYEYALRLPFCLNRSTVIQNWTHFKNTESLFERLKC